jgi:hypothetical protein
VTAAEQSVRQLHHPRARPAGRGAETTHEFHPLSGAVGPNQPRSTSVPQTHLFGSKATRPLQRLPTLAGAVILTETKSGRMPEITPLLRTPVKASPIPARARRRTHFTQQTAMKFIKRGRRGDSG